MISNPASKSTLEELPSRILTGILQEVSEGEMPVRELESHYTNTTKAQNMTYSQQLADPRWRAKRLSILERDNYTCVNCSSKKKLQVHHIKYTGFAWEAPDADLITVCDSCHKELHSRPQNYTNLGSFYMTYQYASRKAYGLAGEAMLTIGKLLTEVKDENQIFIKQSVVAKEFGIARVTFIRHLNRAKEIGLIEPDPKEGDAQHNIHLWRICPFLVWKGERAALDRYLATLPKDHIWLTEWKG